MEEDVTNAVRLVFSRAASFTLDDLMKETPELRQVKLPEIGHIVVHRPMSTFSQPGQFALFGFNRDGQIIATEYRMHHDAKWSAEAEFQTAKPLLQKRCGGTARHNVVWERRDRLAFESYTWRSTIVESVTLKQVQLKLRNPQRMVCITRQFVQPAAVRSLGASLADLFH